MSIASSPTPELHSEVQGHSIVLLGNFNPTIFQPAWFAAQHLIRPEESETAKIEIVHPEIVRFSLDWLSLEVTTGRFTATTIQPASFEFLRDLVQGTFHILRHTPVTKMGLNRELHIPVRSEDEWHAFGHFVAPKEPWDGILEKAGLISLTMQGLRIDGPRGAIYVSVEPSTRVHPGIFFRVNDHYEVVDSSKNIGCDEILDILRGRWSKSMRQSDEIVASLLKRRNDTSKN